MAKYYNLASLDSEMILFIVYSHALYSLYFSIYLTYFKTECSVKRINVKEINRICRIRFTYKCVLHSIIIIKKEVIKVINNKLVVR